MAGLLVTLGLRLTGVLTLPWWLIGALALTLALLIVVGVYIPRFGLFGRALCHVPGARGLVALTFDDGPDPESTPRVLHALTSRNHRATFFPIGSKAARHPDIIEAILRTGCTVGNHTYSHSWLTPFFGEKRLLEELDKATQVLMSTGGPLGTPRFTRPPVALFGPSFVAAAEKAGLVPVAFSARAGDASLVPLSCATILRRVSRALVPGAIIVLHDGSEAPERPSRAPELIGPILDLLEERGLRSVTLEELVAQGQAPAPLGPQAT